MANSLHNVGAIRPRKNYFPLKYRRLFDCDMGQVIPADVQMMMPGDVFKFNIDTIIRTQPMIKPILQEIAYNTYTIFCPIRILDEQFEDSSTGGEMGEFTNPDTTGENPVIKFPKWQGTSTQKYSLWDYFGFPCSPQLATPQALPEKVRPVDWIRRGYYLIYDEYFRDQSTTERLSKQINDKTYGTIDYIYRACYKKDYFTSALPDYLKGNPPALPIQGLTSAKFDIQQSPEGVSNFIGSLRLGSTPFPQFYGNRFNALAPFSQNQYLPTWIDQGGLPQQTSIGVTPATTPGQAENFKKLLERNTVDLSTASTFDVNDLRAVVQTWKWMERNMRAGSKFVESIESRWGVHPGDYRLQRPEFIGGTKGHVIVSEVLQTGQPTQTSTLPQGNMSGHGLTANIGKVRAYKAKEWGIMYTLLVIRPRRNYTQGIDRQFILDDMYDLPFPEFMHLGEREILNCEIYAKGDNSDLGEWGYRPMYDEHRFKTDRIMGDMRDLQSYWSINEKFADRPELNQQFLECNPNKDIFFVKDMPSFIVHMGFKVATYRPLPVLGEPGMIDHF